MVVSRVRACKCALLQSRSQYRIVEIDIGWRQTRIPRIVTKSLSARHECCDSPLHASKEPFAEAGFDAFCAAVYEGIISVGGGYAAVRYAMFSLV
jgi:hypothetical protein